MSSESSRLVVVTGVGFRGSASDNVFNSKEAKANLGAWSALKIAGDGLPVLAVARSEEKLKRVVESIREVHPHSNITERSADVLDRTQVSKLVKSIDSNTRIDLVHSVGLSSGAYTIPEDNPYLNIGNTPDDLPTREFDTVVRSLLLMVQELLPRWELQAETNLVVIASMSGIRPYPLGYAHASAKAGLHHAVRVLTLELLKKGVYVSEINPGMVDTGMYDSIAVKEAVTRIAKEFGYDYSKGELPQAPPESIADLALVCLRSRLHVLSVNAVAKGQFPHAGA
ncbi:MAG: SDR family oxidoreductase [Fimbriimonadaceae bacterium]|nr:SDR family oxidoreductase [Fimbriimonadaceae bacterium]